ncbi:hypothetical protein B0H15DRAFT_308956 [Mycena belliarum]|uniref:Uncharacterized protein n=1 Tax=Mycena belliarum TaxID=1033014 RepID=A0AAD6U2F6_9AGAR|nr:hypothetical protein B0H15DRAFT_308956 [Mycena belliae]
MLISISGLLIALFASFAPAAVFDIEYPVPVGPRSMSLKARREALHATQLALDALEEPFSVLHVPHGYTPNLAHSEFVYTPRVDMPSAMLHIYTPNFAPIEFVYTLSVDASSTIGLPSLSSPCCDYTLAALPFLILAFCFSCRMWRRCFQCFLSPSLILLLVHMFDMPSSIGACLWCLVVVNSASILFPVVSTRLARLVLVAKPAIVRLGLHLCRLHLIAMNSMELELVSQWLVPAVLQVAAMAKSYQCLVQKAVELMIGNLSVEPIPLAFFAAEALVSTVKGIILLRVSLVFQRAIFHLAVIPVDLDPYQLLVATDAAVTEGLELRRLVDALVVQTTVQGTPVKENAEPIIPPGDDVLTATTPFQSRQSSRLRMHSAPGNLVFAAASIPAAVIPRAVAPTPLVEPSVCVCQPDPVRIASKLPVPASSSPVTSAPGLVLVPASPIHAPQPAPVFPFHATTRVMPIPLATPSLRHDISIIYQTAPHKHASAVVGPDLVYLTGPVPLGSMRSPPRKARHVRRGPPVVCHGGSNITMHDTSARALAEAQQRDALKYYRAQHRPGALAQQLNAAAQGRALGAR